MKSAFNAVLTVLALSVTIAAVADYFGSNVVAFVGNACRRQGYRRCLRHSQRAYKCDPEQPLPTRVGRYDDEVMNPKPASSLRP